MQDFRTILLDVDATAALHPAFTQACDLAAQSGARLTVVDVMEDVPQDAKQVITSKIERELIDHRLEALRKLAKSRSDVEIDTAVLRGKPAISLIREVLRSDHDLVIRSHGRDLVPSRAFGSIDTQLLRECPCPVWLLGPEERSEPGHILVTVDVESDVPDAGELNRHIIDIALTLGEVERARITVLYVWALFGQRLLKSHMQNDQYKEALESNRRSATGALDALIDEFGTRAADVRRVCINGEPGLEIPEFATTHGADLVVMGTVARSGVAGFLMGNTAETVLRALKGSVIAVKPPSFETPVRLEDATAEVKTD